MPFLKGIAPIRNTLWYLKEGKLFLREPVKIVTLVFSDKEENTRHKGARDFYFWHWGQLQHKNPTVQLSVFKHLSSPFPYLQAFLNNGREVLIDIDGYDREGVHDRLSMVLGKSEAVLERERIETERRTNPADFGPTCKRQCMCEVSGQMPCPKLVPLPDYLRGKWRWNKNII